MVVAAVLAVEMVDSNDVLGKVVVVDAFSTLTLFSLGIATLKLALLPIAAWSPVRPS